MTNYKNNVAIDAWVTRLGRVLAEDAGSQPVIRRAPFEAPDAALSLSGETLWWTSADATPVTVGISAADAAMLQTLRKNSEAGAAGFSDMLTRSLGRGESVEQPPAEATYRETYRVEFAGGESVTLLVALAETPQQDTSNLDMLMDIELPIMLRFGSTKMALRDIAGLSSGSIIEFDRGVDEPVEVMLNDHVVARGEAVMVKGAYGVRISEIASRRERLISSSAAAGEQFA
ncbi:MAG TPA: FliM/FliN family flagellar motor switch protein [Bryobacteraceae bacterium]|nr:FliM/FliN family flagellar motor switch protein [Bryobacteraceae bacterium]